MEIFALVRRSGKGISAEVQTFPTALGIQVNTCMTVTFREALFIRPIFFGFCLQRTVTTVTARFFLTNYFLPIKGVILWNIITK